VVAAGIDGMGAVVAAGVAAVGVGMDDGVGEADGAAGAVAGSAATGGVADEPLPRDIVLTRMIKNTMTTPASPIPSATFQTSESEWLEGVGWGFSGWPASGEVEPANWAKGSKPAPGD
jgi:hypothetical protein